MKDRKPIEFEAYEGCNEYEVRDLEAYIEILEEKLKIAEDILIKNKKSFESLSQYTIGFGCESNIIDIKEALSKLKD